MRRNKSYKTQIIVALIGLVGVISAALIANWGKIITPPDGPENDKMEKIDQLFSQLDTVDADRVREGTRELMSLYAKDPGYAEPIFTRLKPHLSLLTAPHDLITDGDEKFGTDKQEAEKKAKRKEEDYIEPLQKLIAQFGRDRRKQLFRIVLDNRALVFGRIIAADKLCAMEGKGIYWNELLEDSDPYFRELTVNAVRDRSQSYIEDVLIYALRKRDIRMDAIYGLRDKLSKKAVPHLIDIIEHDSSEYARLAAYEALERIDPEKAEKFQRPPKPAPLKLPRLF